MIASKRGALIVGTVVILTGLAIMGVGMKQDDELELAGHHLQSIVGPNGTISIIMIPYYRNPRLEAIGELYRQHRAESELRKLPIGATKP